MAGCSGKALNLTRHLANCHRYLSSSDRQKVVEKHRYLTKLQRTKAKAITLGSSPTKQKPKKPRYRLTQCCVCDKAVKRLDAHVVAVHQVKRRTEEFLMILRVSHCVEDEEREGAVNVPVDSGEAKISVSDGIKDFLVHFEGHLSSYTSMVPSSKIAEIRMVKDVLNHATGDDVLSTLTGATVCKYFQDIDQPHGFLHRKMLSNCSPNYARKIVSACLRAVDSMESATRKEYRISLDAKLDITKRQKCIGREYSKIWYMNMLVWLSGGTGRC